MSAWNKCYYQKNSYSSFKTQLSEISRRCPSLPLCSDSMWYRAHHLCGCYYSLSPPRLWYLPERDCMPLSHPCVPDGQQRVGALCVKRKGQSQENNGVFEACFGLLLSRTVTEQTGEGSQPGCAHSFPRGCNNSEGGGAKLSLSCFPPWPVPRQFLRDL